MAFNEGLKQKIDLLGALEARRRMEQIGANDDLQRQLMQEQLKAAEFQNMKAMDVPTMTVPSSGLTGMPTKKFLHEMPGYISGVDPTEVFREWNQNFRQGMASGGGGGGGEDAGNTHSDPYSNYTPNQLSEMNAINEWQPQQAKRGIDSVTVAGELSALYRQPGGEQVGGSVGGGSTGRYVDMMGNEMATGTAPAEKYISGIAGAEEVNKILRDRENAPGQRAGDKATVLNQQAKSVASDQRFKELDSDKQKTILNNIETEVMENYKKYGTPILNVAELIAKYSK
jgi:hypothetical protein